MLLFIQNVVVVRDFNPSYMLTSRSVSAAIHTHPRATGHVTQCQTRNYGRGVLILLQWHSLLLNAVLCNDADLHLVTLEGQRWRYNETHIL
jgi:hypothetical protein